MVVRVINEDCEVSGTEAYMWSGAVHYGTT